MGVKCNIFYALYEGQTQHILRFLWGTDATVYILRSIWGTDAIYFTLDMMDKHNIFYALFDVYCTRFLRHQASIITVMTKYRITQEKLMFVLTY